MGFTSSGVTNVRPSLAAMTCAALSRAMLARGLAPSSMALSSRVRRTSSTMYVTTASSTRMLRAKACIAKSSAGDVVACSIDRSVGSNPSAWWRTMVRSTSAGGSLTVSLNRNRSSCASGSG